MASCALVSLYSNRHRLTTRSRPLALPLPCASREDEGVFFHSPPANVRPTRTARTLGHMGTHALHGMPVQACTHRDALLISLTGVTTCEPYSRLSTLQHHSIERAQRVRILIKLHMHHLVRRLRDWRNRNEHRFPRQLRMGRSAERTCSAQSMHDITAAAGTAVR